MVPITQPRASLRRRSFLVQGLAGLAFGSKAVAQQPVALADMHTHMGLLGRQLTPGDLAGQMRAHGVRLVAWTFTSDDPWLGTDNTGVFQKATPAAGEPMAHMLGRLRVMSEYARQNGLPIIRTVADLDATSITSPGLLIACEGSDFLEGDIERLSQAASLGLRHLQLVHYIQNPVGDFQTSPPTHGGLSPLGRRVITACEDQGILVDLAHCSAGAVDNALDVARKPMLWSHGWVEGSGGSHKDSYGFMKRRLSTAQARKIAARGGVIGLWGLGLKSWNAYWGVGINDSAGYAREIARLVRLVGADHVGIGSDMGGVGENWSVNDYGHVRQVLQRLENEKLSAEEIEKVASGNFVRLLRQTLPA